MCTAEFRRIGIPASCSEEPWRISTVLQEILNPFSRLFRIFVWSVTVLIRTQFQKLCFVLTEQSKNRFTAKEEYFGIPNLLSNWFNRVPTKWRRHRRSGSYRLQALTTIFGWFVAGFRPYLSCRTKKSARTRSISTLNLNGLYETKRGTVSNSLQNCATESPHPNPKYPSSFSSTNHSVK